eukprot:COSAG06_NODE_28379_length_575_cov_1.281513_1_plen_61_part_01
MLGTAPRVQNVKMYRPQPRIGARGAGRPFNSQQHGAEEPSASSVAWACAHTPSVTWREHLL